VYVNSPLQKYVAYDSLSLAASVRIMRKAEFGKALRKARLAAGMTQAGLARRLGVHEQTVQRWEAGKAMPPRTRLRGIEVFLRDAGVQPEAFMVGEPNSARISGPSGARTLPLYAMGEVGEGRLVRIDDIEVGPRQAQMADQAFVVRGPAMKPWFRDGDIVGVRAQGSALPGQIVVALADGQITFRRFEGEIEGKAILCPLNPEERPLVPDSCRIVGIYRWLWRESPDGRAPG